MKSRLLVTWGFEFGGACLALAAVFLVLYFVFRQSDTGKGKAKKPILWLILSASSYLLAFGGLIFMMIAYFQMFIPTMGDFSSVSWQGGNMTASNGDGDFMLSDETECLVSQNGKPYHQVSFTLKSDFDKPVTLQAFQAVSRIDEKDFAAYSGPITLPFLLAAGASQNIELRGEVTDRIREHTTKEAKDDYGLTAYLTVVTSEGKLPGIPLHFPDQPCK